MGNIELVAGEDQPPADSRVNIWIGGTITNGPRAGRLAIMTQIDGGESRCVGTVEPSPNKLFSLCFKFDSGEITGESTGSLMLDVHLSR